MNRGCCHIFFDVKTPMYRKARKPFIIVFLTCYCHYFRYVIVIVLLVVFVIFVIIALLLLCLFLYYLCCFYYVFVIDFKLLG